MSRWPNLHTKKKSCRGCRADRYDGVLLPKQCELGYNICWVGTEETNRHISIPMESCPKPTTNSDYIEARRWYRKIGGKA